MTGCAGSVRSKMEANLTAILDTLAAKHIPVLLSGMLAPPNLGRSIGTRSVGCLPGSARGRA